MKPEPIGSMLKKGMENRHELNEMLKFLENKIPIILDMENETLRYDTDNIYYKIYQYIYNNEERKRK